MPNILPPEQVANTKEPRIYDSPLDEGIRVIVETLNARNVETFESCEGGNGHAYAEPTVRFHGNKAEGLRALSVAITAGLPVRELRRTWPMIDGEPTGPYWEMTFFREHSKKKKPNVQHP